MQPLTDKKHILSLNFLRGIAALSVCCFHILSEGFDGYPELKALFSKGYLGLDLFFVISGFIIPYSMYQNGYSIDRFYQFIIKRSIRIEPPYIISFLLIIGMRILYTYIHNYNNPSDHWVYTHDWMRFWLHFGYLNQYFGYEPYAAVYWTLAIEFQFYILMGVLFPLLLSNKKLVPLFVFLIFGGLSWFLDLKYNWFIFQYGFLFCTGILIFLYTINRISAARLVLLGGIVICLMYYKNGLEVSVTALFATACIIFIDKEWRISNFMGKISYSFYLIHGDAAGWFILLLGSSVTDNTLLRILAVIFAIVFAAVFYYLFERPALQFSKKIKYAEENKNMASPTIEKHSPHYFKWPNFLALTLSLGLFLFLILNERLNFINVRTDGKNKALPLQRVEENPTGERIALQAANGKFLCADNHIVLANRDSAFEWETFILVKLDKNENAFYTHEKLFLSTNLAHISEVESRSKSIKDWEKYRIEGLGEGYIAIKAINGKYLSLDVKKQQIFATANAIGSNEKFKVWSRP
ncbi:MAG: acyltransferase family protein [Bacteroidia bacterium]